MSSCAKKPAAETESGSSLTAVNIQLPAKSKLPAELQGKELAYCFIASESSPAYVPVKDIIEDGEDTNCLVGGDSVPVYDSANLQKFGLYTESVKLEAKLSRNTDYVLEIAIGVAGKANTLSKTYYRGYAFVQRSEMVGKDKLSKTILLENTSSEMDLPSIHTISDEGDIDVDVQVQLPETGTPIIEGDDGSTPV
jgi:hypothetical protein